MTLTPYIMFNGTCEEALNFYVKALGGEIKEMHRFEGSPAEGMSADKQKIMHAHFAAKGVFFSWSLCTLQSLIIGFLEVVCEETGRCSKGCGACLWCSTGPICNCSKTSTHVESSKTQESYEEMCHPPQYDCGG